MKLCEECREPSDTSTCNWCSVKIKKWRRPKEDRYYMERFKVLKVATMEG